MRTVNIVFDRTPEPPFSGSTAVVNAYLCDSLRELGCTLNATYGPLSTPDDYTPLRMVDKVKKLRSQPIADVQLWCDMGLGLSPLHRRPPQKNVVFFHGLAGFPGHWLGNEDIDKYWCNSPYQREVLRSLAAMPDWNRRRLLDPRAFAIVSSMTLALPCVEAPAGVPTEGAGSLPREARAALDGRDVLGHCVANKLDERAVYAILLYLNELSLTSGDGRRFRLLIEESTFHLLAGRLREGADIPPEFLPLKGALDQLGLGIEDILIPLPQLAQPLLFELLQACQFGLFYHRVPEPFGLLPLESVFHGCPIYTNGAGNLRHLLPAGCGINVHETEDMVFGDLAVYRDVAHTIFVDVVQEPARQHAACQRGGEYIRQVYTRQAMTRDVAELLRELDTPPAGAEMDFESLVITLSPLVRSWSGATRRVISDYRSMELSEDESSLVEASLGELCGNLSGSLKGETLRAMEKLFREGVLTLAAPPPPAPATALRRPENLSSSC